MVVYAGVNGTKGMTEVYLKETVGATQVKKMGQPSDKNEHTTSASDLGRGGTGLPKYRDGLYNFFILCRNGKLFFDILAYSIRFAVVLCVLGKIVNQTL